EATIYGGELEIMARPLPALTIGTSIGYTHGEFDDLIGADPFKVPTDFSGNTTAYTPEWTFNCFLSYSIPVKNYGFVTLYADYDWKDEVYVDPANSDDYHFVPDYGLFNAQVSFETHDGKWHVDFYGKNLDDERYLTNSQTAVGIAYITNDIIGIYSMDARRFGIRVGYRF
ncbi:MAG: TonB-dependent receptor, partial [Deltaproteobacteria bacterium]|nr:TonB-dependent receptor [Deltaproteobacteria bacterium]